MTGRFHSCVQRSRVRSSAQSVRVAPPPIRHLGGVATVATVVTAPLVLALALAVLLWSSRQAAAARGSLAAARGSLAAARGSLAAAAMTHQRFLQPPFFVFVIALQSFHVVVFRAHLLAHIRIGLGRLMLILFHE